MRRLKGLKGTIIKNFRNYPFNLFLPLDLTCGKGMEWTLGEPIWNLEKDYNIICKVNNVKKKKKLPIYGNRSPLIKNVILFNQNFSP